MSKLIVNAKPENITFIENFIYTSKDIPNDKRIAALIIATEIFDNITEHAILIENTRIQITATNIFFPRLQFKYYSKNFDSLLQALKVTKPHFDAQAKRYRGFGLLMTRNLARKVKYRKRFSAALITVYL